MLPKRHASAPEGQNVAPAIEWSGLPAGTKEVVVIVEDPFPHAKIFVHWVLYGIPPSATGVPEGLRTDEPNPGGFVQGENDFGHLGWGGPIPRDEGPPHKYWFWVYASDTKLNLEPGATKAAVLDAMSRGHHILANGRVIGVYPR